MSRADWLELGSSNDAGSADVNSWQIGLKCIWLFRRCRVAASDQLSDIDCFPSHQSNDIPLTPQCWRLTAPVQLYFLDFCLSPSLYWSVCLRPSVSASLRLLEAGLLKWQQRLTIYSSIGIASPRFDQFVTSPITNLLVPAVNKTTVRCKRRRMPAWLLFRLLLFVILHSVHFTQTAVVMFTWNSIDRHGWRFQL